MASPLLGDVNVSNIIALGSLSINLGEAPTPIQPRLPQFPIDKIIVDGELDLFLALRWDYNSETSFVGRDTELDRVLAWAESDSRDVELRLISGGAGVGKTRLAAEAAKILRSRGWSAGFLPRQTKQIDVVSHQDKGLLLIVDYLEERLELVEGLCERISDIGETPLPIRILFLSRGKFENLPPVFRLVGHRIGRQEIAALETLRLEDCLKLAKSVSDRLSIVLDRMPADDLSEVEEWLKRDKRHQTPLMAQSVGIASVVLPQDIGGSTGADLVDKIVERECLKITRAEKHLGLPDKSIMTCVALSAFTEELLKSSITERILKDTYGSDAHASIISNTGWWVAKEDYGSSGIGRQEPDLIASALVLRYFKDCSEDKIRTAFTSLAEKVHQDFLQQYDRVLFDMCYFPGGAETAAQIHNSVYDALADSLWKSDQDKVFPRSQPGSHWSRDIASRLAKQALQAELALPAKIADGAISQAMATVRSNDVEFDRALVSDALNAVARSEASSGSLDVAIEAAGVALNNSLADWDDEQALGHPRRCLILGGLLAQRYDSSKDDVPQALAILGDAVKDSESIAILGVPEELRTGSLAAFEIAEMMRRGGYRDAAEEAYRKVISLADRSFPSGLFEDLDSFVGFEDLEEVDFDKYDEAWQRLNGLSGIELAALVKDETAASEFAQVIIRKSIAHYRIGELDDALRCRRTSDQIFGRLVEHDKSAHFFERYRYLREHIQMLEEADKAQELEEFYAGFANDEQANQLAGIHRPLFILSGWLVAARRLLASEDYETAKHIGLEGASALEAQPRIIQEVVWALDVAVECHSVLVEVAANTGDVESEKRHIERSLSLLSDSCKIDGTGSFYRYRLEKLRGLAARLKEVNAEQSAETSGDLEYSVAVADAVWSQMLERNEGSIPWIAPPWSRDFKLNHENWWRRFLRKVGL